MPEVQNQTNARRVYRRKQQESHRFSSCWMWNRNRNGIFTDLYQYTAPDNSVFERLRHCRGCELEAPQLEQICVQRNELATLIPSMTEQMVVTSVADIP